MLDTCCFCLKLRVGALIIAYIQLIGYIIGLVVVLKEMVTNRLHIAKVHDGMTRSLEGAFNFLCVLLLILITCLIFNILLLVGIFKKKRGCISAYLVFNTILAILSFIGCIYNIFTGGNGMNIFCNFGTITLLIYCWTVIRSYQMTINEGAGQVLYTPQEPV